MIFPLYLAVGLLFAGLTLCLNPGPEYHETIMLASLVVLIWPAIVAIMVASALFVYMDDFWSRK